MSKAIFLLSSILSFWFNSLLLYIAQKKRIFLDEPKEERKIHKKPVPRIGGLGIFLSILFTLFVYIPQKIFFFKLLVSLLPVEIVGIIEDWKRTSPYFRFSFMLLSAIFSVILLKTVVINLGIVYLPYLLAIIFSIVAIVGMINAFNIIDGLNGLASSIAIIGLAGYLYLIHKYSYFYPSWLEYFLLASIGAIVGFFFLNFPFGKIFLGDSGSYLIGFIVAISSIIIGGQENSPVSPWVVPVIFFYPIWETLFSAFRRLREGKNPFEPDKKHLHYLIANYLNSPILSSFILMLAQIVITLIALYFHQNTVILMMVSLCLVLIYSVIFSKLIKLIST